MNNLYDEDNFLFGMTRVLGRGPARAGPVKIAREKGNDFFASWKDYRKGHPINNPQAEDADEEVRVAGPSLVSELMGDSDGEVGEAQGPAAHDAAAPAQLTGSAWGLH